MKKLTLEVIMSCMHQTDVKIAYKSNIQTDLVLVNQCDRDSQEVIPLKREDGKSFEVKFICTTERGLSKSRNMAIRNAEADICLIADDDEVFVENYDDIILSAFEQHPEYDVIAFKVDGTYSSKKKYAQKACKVNYITALSIGSWQLAFRKHRIIEKGILFDEEMGSGTGHGASEEVKFQFDCLRRKLRIQYLPLVIARMQKDSDSGSQWFHGFTPRYFLEQGWSTRRLMGLPLATLYSLYYVAKRYPVYQTECSFFTALHMIMKGVWDKQSVYLR